MISGMSDNTYRRPITWVSSTCTDVGTVRKVNEDSIITRPEMNFWAVADGMGGHNVGDVASIKVVEALQSLAFVDNFAENVEQIEDCLEQVNKQLLEYSRIMFEGGVMGSTVVIMIIRGRIGACLWVGDSRLYRFRSNKLTQLSRDHSQVEDMIETSKPKCDYSGRWCGTVAEC
jgi:serine/threonine protein phosphatase PrpC